MLAALLGSLAIHAQTAPWTQLFNGKDLTGWTAKIKGFPVGENYADTFRVEDGLLKVRYDQYKGEFNGRFGHLYTNRTYSRYRLRAVYRFVGEQCLGGPAWAWRNNGLMIHSQAPWSLTLDQEFPVSIEVQLLGGDGKNERHNVNLCTPGTNVVYQGKLFLAHCMDSSSKTCHGDEWHTAEVEVDGSARIRHYLDGELVLEYTEPQLDERDETAKPFLIGGWKLLDSGHIAIQAESHPTDFKSIEIRPL
ncbi:MAG: DUF1080 domain-containing protein [Fimbriimonadaceae bacterium]|nr:DUF1080 domain-containing protein [Fimbriimonadaceae bacterium]